MDKKKLYESIMNSVSKEVKKALLEYRTKATESYDVNIQEAQKYLKTSIQQWISDKFKRVPQCYHGFYSGWSNSGAIYIHFGDVIEGKPINVYVDNRSYVTNIKDDLEKIVEYMKDHKEFKLKAASIARKERLEYEYYPNKDEELYNKLTEAKNKFEAEVSAVNTDKYAPTVRDWMKMIDYKNRHSNPERVANSCKDNNKIVARYIIANTLGWKEAVKAFKDRIYDLNILNDAQLEAYRRKYATYNIPEDIKELIDDLQEYDEKGGFGEAEHSEIFPENLKKYIHQNNNINSYKIKLIDGAPVKEHRTQRVKIAPHQYNYHSYTIPQGTINQAEVIFKFFDNSELELYYVYRKKNGNYVGRFYKSKIVIYDWDDYKRLFNATSAVHTLKFCFDEED